MPLRDLFPKWITKKFNRTTDRYDPRDDPTKRPTYLLVYSWSQSFEALMKSKTGQKYFIDFCEAERSDDNLLFWMACEELKGETKQEKIENKRGVALSSEAREIVNKNMNPPTITTFDSAQKEVYSLMKSDTYPRFLTSHLYKKLLEAHVVLEDS